MAVVADQGGRRAAGALLTQVVAQVLDTDLSDADLTDRLDALRLDRMARLLQLRIAAMSVAAGARARALLDSIPEEVAAQFLRAPALCECLRRNDSDRLVALLEAAGAQGREQAFESWSVLGDRWLGHSAPALSACAGADVRQTGRLSCGVPIDGSLAAHPSCPSAGLRQPTVPTGDVLAAQIEHIDASLAVLATADPLGYRIFAALAANLVVRCDVARLGECWGATSGIAIGRVVLVNATAEPDLRRVAEALLHEATHLALDCAELARPLWRTDCAPTVTAVESPWTGNPLTPHAFLHACVVWAVLWHFWEACQRKHGTDPEARARQQYIEAGFDRMTRQADIAGALQSLAPAARAVHRAVCSALRGAAVGQHEGVFAESD
jgi:hypothetical protein